MILRRWTHVNVLPDLPSGQHEQELNSPLLPHSSLDEAPVLQLTRMCIYYLLYLCSLQFFFFAFLHS
jgi:hypothetical protein